MTGRKVTGRKVTQRKVTGWKVTGRKVTGRKVTGRKVTGHLEGEQVLEDRHLGRQEAGNTVHPYSGHVGFIVTLASADWTHPTQVAVRKSTRSGRLSAVNPPPKYSVKAALRLDETIKSLQASPGVGYVTLMKVCPL